MADRSNLVRSDADHLLGFGGPGAWAIFAAFAATVLVLALNGGAPSQSPVGIAATVAVLAAGLLGVLPASYPLPLSRTVAIVALTAGCNLAITLQLSPAVWPGWASWNFGMTAITLMTLSLRGRILASWIGLFIMSGIAISWSWVAGGSPRLGFDLVYMHLGINLAITFFALGLRRAVTRITALRAVEAARVSELAAREAAEAERVAELEHLTSYIEPALRRIADGALTDAAEAGRFRVLEAGLRDRIRARRLNNSVFRTAVDSARARGVDIVLLDDAVAWDIDSFRLDGALTWAAGLLDDTPSGSATVRLAGPDTIALTVVATDPPLHERMAIDT
jgi:hypothetical protein